MSESTKKTIKLTTLLPYFLILVVVASALYVITGALKKSDLKKQVLLNYPAKINFDDNITGEEALLIAQYTMIQGGYDNAYDIGDYKFWYNSVLDDWWYVEFYPKSLVKKRAPFFLVCVNHEDGKTKIVGKRNKWRFNDSIDKLSNGNH